MNQHDWEYTANEIQLRVTGKVGGTYNIFKDDVIEAHKVLNGSTFWGIVDQYNIRKIVEDILNE